ncbi:hypothetical protein GGR92_005277 [Spirosoma lacussanchae]|uniref:hypothetical protein n=1 Tax=Spirosoma lacussanchae TaxID=1884249 RepID=UPI001107AE79|nr:hypothetical protein [Spirosoma lacussanchae]
MKYFTALALFLFTLSCSTDSKPVEQRQSKWTPDQIKSVADDYKGTDFERFQVQNLAYKQQYDMAPSEFAENIKSGEVARMIEDSTMKDAYQYGFDIDRIAGKTPKQIAAMFGKPTSSETTNPSRTPCPCPKKEYLSGIVEIVYMNNKADWITINLNGSGNVTSKEYEIQNHDSYYYIKAFTY